MRRNSTLLAVVLLLLLFLCLHGCENLGTIVIEDNTVLNPKFSIQTSGIIQTKLEAELNLFQVSVMPGQVDDVVWLIKYDHTGKKPRKVIKNIVYGAEIEGYKTIVPAKKLELGKIYEATSVLVLNNENGKVAFPSRGEFMLAGN